MALYKIVLVDDEEEIRRSIIRRIKWEELGFVVVGEAENGIEALDVIDKVAPDLVVTDIRMPFMDGIKLAENVRDRYPTTKVVVISGFDDFEYAQEAMKLGVLRYILKPINAYEMNELLGEIKGVLDEEILSRNNLEKLKRNYEKSLPLLKERFLNHWIEDYVARDMIEENRELFGLNIGQAPMTVAVVRPDTLLSKEEDLQLLKNKTLLRMAIFNVCEEVVRNNQLGIVFMKMNEIVILIPLEAGESTEGSRRIGIALEAIRGKVEKYLNTTITIGVGNSCIECSFLYKSYLQAVSALDYTISHGNNKVIYIEDIEPDHAMPLTLDEVDERGLLAAIKIGKEEDITKYIGRIMAKLAGSHLTIGDYQVYILEVFASLMKLVHRMELDSKVIFPGGHNFFQHMSGLRTKEDIQEWLIKVSLKIAAAMGEKRTTSCNEIIEKAKAYIDSHYENEDLSAELVCNHLHISTNYFSALFKKETNLTFTSYLTQLRIEKAKELLRSTTMKAFAIGNQVGYAEGHYFSYVFKKVTGIAPTEYRNGKV